MKNRLTAKTVNSLKMPGYFADGGNLFLQVSATGSKSWLFIYKRAGKKFEVGMGSQTIVSLSDARDKAQEYRKLLNNGIDPLTEKRRIDKERLLMMVKTMTFAQCAESFINKHQHELKNAKHIQQWTNTLSQYAYPYIGQLPVQDIDTALVVKCLEPIWLTKNETASRVRGRIEQVLSWATVSGFRTGENPARWRGHLDKLLAKPSKVQDTVHHGALPYAELGEFIQKLRVMTGVAAKCLRFTILTAARTGESIGATWDEIDLDAKTWTIPAARMKAEREHRVPLSGHALNILNEMAAVRLNNYVFPGSKKGLSNMAMLAVLKRMDRTDITVHGFRSTFSDWTADCTAYSSEVREMALAHTIKNQAEAAYRRGDLMEKRRLLMDDWAGYCDG